MTLLIGVDEAGYGPNLGPLAIAVSAWRTTSSHNLDLYSALAPAVARQPKSGRLAIADSKTLYKPGSGLKHLEIGVLAALAVRAAHATSVAHAAPPARWSELIAAARTVDWTDASSLPWHRDFNPALPVDGATAEVFAAVQSLDDACQAADLRLLDLRVRLIFPAEYNQLVAEQGTKGAALSHATLALVRRVVDDLPTDVANDEAVEIVCDKHGGRNHYCGLVQHHFPESWVTPLVESRAMSRYRCDAPHGQLHVAFRTKGEEFLPAALASMSAKYLRELAMRAFNAYWTTQIPGLRPTAGYPVDAKRFKAEIASKQCELGIVDDALWRSR